MTEVLLASSVLDAQLAAVLAWPGSNHQDQCWEAATDYLASRWSRGPLRGCAAWRSTRPRPRGGALPGFEQIPIPQPPRRPLAQGFVPGPQ